MKTTSALKPAYTFISPKGTTDLFQRGCQARFLAPFLPGAISGLLRFKLAHGEWL
jgi:hypothetical protein